jgi:hypothetical protein
MRRRILKPRQPVLRIQQPAARIYQHKSTAADRRIAVSDDD